MLLDENKRLTDELAKQKQELENINEIIRNASAPSPNGPVNEPRVCLSSPSVDSTLQIFSSGPESSL